MTFKDLHRFVQIHAPQEYKKIEELVIKCRNIPFYRWSSSHYDLKVLHRIDNYHKDRNEFCCFNHLIGLPEKNGKQFPLFDYEREIYKGLALPWYYNSRIDNTAVDPTQSVIEKRKARELSNQRVFASFKNKHLWIKKATGLGVTEFMLRFMAWLCLMNDDYKNSQMVIVTGPNQDIAIKLIKRMKGLFENIGITFDSK